MALAKNPLATSPEGTSAESSGHSGSLEERQCPWVNCRELCLQTPLSIGQQAPGEPLCEQPGWGVQGQGGFLPVSADVCCLVEEVGAWQLR